MNANLDNILGIINAEIAEQDAWFANAHHAFQRNEAHAARMVLLSVKNQILLNAKNNHPYVDTYIIEGNLS